MEHGEKNESLESIVPTERVESVLLRPKFLEFVTRRNIKPEDLPLIEELAAFPKRLVVSELHNMFNGSHERAGAELASLIRGWRQECTDVSVDARRSSELEQKIALCEMMLAFFERYDWPTCYHLVRLLEGEISD